MEYTNPVVEIIRDGVNNPKIKLKFPEYCSIMEIYKDDVLINTITNSRYIVSPTFNDRYIWSDNIKNIWIGRTSTRYSIPDLNIIQFLFNNGIPYGNIFTLELLGDDVQFSLDIKKTDGSVQTLSGGNTFSNEKLIRTWSLNSSDKYTDIHFWRSAEVATNYVFIKNNGISDEVTYEIQSNGKYTVKCKGIRGLVEDKLFSIGNFTVPFSIKLYNNISDNHKLDKKLINELHLTGTLRGNSSIIEPSFDIELDSFPTYNYCYIPEFNRYYFINDIVSVRNNLWRISCSVDVLTSFKSNIRQLSAYIGRQEFKFNKDIRDDKFPISLDYDTIIDKGTPKSYIDNQGISRHEFDVFDSNYTIYNYIIRTLGKYNIYETDSDYDNFSSPTTRVYMCNRVNLEQLSNKLFNDEFKYNGSSYVNPQKAIRNISMYPFNINRLVRDFRSKSFLEYPTNFFVCNSELDISGADVIDEKVYQAYDISYGFTTGSIIPFTFDYKRYYNNFLDYEPFTKVEVYIPFVGVIKIPTHYMYDYDYISVRYRINLTTNDSMYELLGTYRETKEMKLLLFGNCELSIDFPVDDPGIFDMSKNMAIETKTYELNNANAGFNLAKNVVGSAANIATGGLLSYLSPTPTSGVSQAVGGVSGLFTSLISGAQEVYNNAETHNINTMKLQELNPTLGSLCGNGVVYSFGLIPLVRITRVKLNEDFNEQYYNHTIGRPSDIYEKLSNLSGYTEIIGVHITDIPHATSKEQDIIDSLLRKGVIL